MWRGRLEGSRDGKISYELDGIANADFGYNRIGICVLHPPAENAGRPFRATTEKGAIEGTLPDLVAPQLIVDGELSGLFPPYTALAISLAAGGEVRFAFEGDRFEMEDQRNCADASFKTYSTPLELGFPHRAAAGQRIRQRMVVTAPEVPPPAESAGPSNPELALGGPTGRKLPPIGLGTASHGGHLSAREAEVLRAVAPDHLRAELDLTDRGHPAELDRALRTCEDSAAPSRSPTSRTRARAPRSTPSASGSPRRASRASSPLPRRTGPGRPPRPRRPSSCGSSVSGSAHRSPGSRSAAGPTCSSPSSQR